MTLAILRSDAPREEFPVYISNRGRSHDDAHEVAQALSEKWDISLGYVPDANSRQGTFYLDATDLSDLEIEGVSLIVGRELRRYRVAYDLADPYGRSE